MKSVSLGSLSTHTPDTWEDNLLLLDSICEVPVLTSAVAQIAKKSGCTSGLSTISNGDTSQNMLLTNGNDDVLESLKKRLECLSFTKSKTIKGKSPTYCHPAYCDDENAAAVSGFDETFRRLCYVIKEMEMAK